MLKITELENNLLIVHEWIKVADQKVSIFLAFQGIVLTMLFPGTFSWVVQNISCFNFIFIILSIGLILIGFYKSISAIIPRLTKDDKKKSITYFGDIAKFDLAKFREAVKKISKEQYEDELIEQIHISSRIAIKKYSQFRGAIFYFFGGVTLLVMVFLISNICYGI